MRTLLLMMVMGVSVIGCVDDAQVTVDVPDAASSARGACEAECSACYMVSLGSYSSGCLCRDACRAR